LTHQAKRKGGKIGFFSSFCFCDFYSLEKEFELEEKKNFIRCFTCFS